MPRFGRAETRKANAQAIRDEKILDPELMVTKKVRRQVFEGSRMGLTWEELSVLLDLPLTFLKKHCRPDFVRGCYDSSLKVCNSLYRMAVGTKKTKPDARAAIFWLQCRARWNTPGATAAVHRSPLEMIDPEKHLEQQQRNTAVLILPANGREKAAAPEVEAVHSSVQQVMANTDGEGHVVEVEADEVVVIEDDHKEPIGPKTKQQACQHPEIHQDMHGDYCLSCGARL